MDDNNPVDPGMNPGGDQPAAPMPEETPAEPSAPEGEGAAPEGEATM